MTGRIGSIRLHVSQKNHYHLMTRKQFVICLAVALSIIATTVIYWMSNEQEAQSSRLNTAASPATTHAPDKHEFKSQTNDLTPPADQNNTSTTTVPANIGKNIDKRIHAALKLPTAVLYHESAVSGRIEYLMTALHRHRECERVVTGKPEIELAAKSNPAQGEYLKKMQQDCFSHGFAHRPVGALRDAGNIGPLAEEILKSAGVPRADVDGDKARQMVRAIINSGSIELMRLTADTLIQPASLAEFGIQSVAEQQILDQNLARSAIAVIACERSNTCTEEAYKYTMCALWDGCIQSLKDFPEVSIYGPIAKRTLIFKAAGETEALKTRWTYVYRLISASFPG